MENRESISRSLEKFILHVDEVYGITISNTDGIVFYRTMRQDTPITLPLFPVRVDLSSPGTNTPSDEMLVMGTDPLSIGFTHINQLVNKFYKGRTRMITSVYADYITFQVYFFSLIITVVTSTSINRGIIYQVIPELKAKLQPLRHSLFVNRESV